MRKSTKDHSSIKFTHALFSTKCYSNWQDIARGIKSRLLANKITKRKGIRGKEKKNKI
jgi:hypothetical protein